MLWTVREESRSFEAKGSEHRCKARMHFKRVLACMLRSLSTSFYFSIWSIAIDFYAPPLCYLKRSIRSHFKGATPKKKARCSRYEVSRAKLQLFSNKPGHSPLII